MITSSQVAGLVGGQQVMFANQAAFAHQISGTMGFGPPMMGQLQNPFPSGMPSYGVAGWDQQSDMGNRIAGGAALSLPAIATGVSLAGGLIGGAAGNLDPYTGVARGFARGAGFAGQGAGATLGGIRSAFATGGLRAGGAAIAGGLGGAAVAAVPYYIAGKAIETVAENMYEGVQNIRDVGRMTQQYFQPAWGQSGAGPGGSQGRGAIKQISAFLHEMAGEDVMTSMRDMRKLMDTAGQMGMLGGVTDVQSFKTKFRNIVNQAKTVAQVLGTSLEEAMPLFATMRQTGTWTPQDIMSTVVSAKALGPAGGQAMMGAMQSGAAMSHAMGGRMGAGAAVGREMMMNVSAMMKSGTLSEEAIMEYTGGVGGAAGQQQVAQGLQQAMIGFSQHPMGQLMLAGLGEIKGNRFTGRMDPELMQKFLRGEVSVDQLSSMGRQRVRNRSTAVSFFNRRGQMGMEMLEQGGMEGMSVAIQQVMDRAGYGGADEEIQNRFIQMITKSDQRLADMVQGQLQDLPRSRLEKARMRDAALEDTIRQIEYRKTRSWQGFKDAMGHMWEESVERPIQESMERFSTDVGDAWDRTTRRLLGMKPTPTGGISMEGAVALAQGGYSTRNQGITQTADRAALEQIINPGGWGNMMINMGRESGQVGLLQTLSKEDLATGDWKAAPRAQMLSRVMGLQLQQGEAGAGEINVGGGMRASEEDTRFAMTRMMEYAHGNVSLERALGRGASAQDRADQDTVNAALEKLWTDPATRKELKRIQEEDPERYHQRTLELMAARDPQGAGAALNRIAAKHPEGQRKAVQLGVLLTAVNEKGYQKSSLNMSVAKRAGEFGDLILAAGSAGEAQAATADALGKVLSSGRLEKGASIGAAIGLFSPIPFSSVAGGAVGAAVASLMGTGLTESELSQLAAPEVASLLVAATDTGTDPKTVAARDEARQKLSRMGGIGDRAMELIEENKIGERERAILQTGLGKMGALEQRKMDDKVQNLAKSQGQINGIQGVGGATAAQIERIRSLYAEGKMAEGEAIVESLGTGGGLTKKEVNRLLSGGGGIAGVQVGREAVISGIREGMTEKEFTAEMNRLSKGGDLFKGALTADQQKGILSKFSGGLTAEEAAAIKKELKAAAQANKASGVGGAAGGGPIGTLEHLLTTYAEKHTEFVREVARVVPALKAVEVEKPPKVEDQKGTTNSPAQGP
jgi:hypothetical protein